MARKATRRAGQGTIYQRKDGRWEGAVTHGYNESGNPKRYTVIKRTQKEASEALNAILAKLSMGVPPTQSSQRLEEFLKTWLETEIKPNRLPKTYRYYEQLARLYITPRIGQKKLKDLSPQIVQALLNKLAGPRTEGGKQLPPLKPHTVNGVRATLRTALNTARKWRLINENPVSLVSPAKKLDKVATYLTVDEAKALLEQCREHHFGNLIAIGLMTGMRLGEATGLTWDDVNFEEEVLRVRTQLQFEEGKFVLRPPKSASGRRTLALNSQALAILRDQKARQLLWESALDESNNELKLVFTTPEGKPLHQKNVDKALKGLAVKAGIKSQISFHKLRHTHATHLAAQGVSLSVVKDQLGHSQIGVTVNTYGHAVPTALRAASEVFERLLDRSEGQN